MTQRILRARLWLGVMLVAGALAANAARAEELRPWRHGLYEAKSDAGIYYMITQGFAEKQGLKLTLVPFKTDSVALKALLAGELDSYDGILTGTVLAKLHGADVKLMGCHWPGLPHGIFVRGNINSVTDLKGKTFAISTPFTLPDVLASALLEKYGMKPTDMRYATLGGDIERYKALAAGLADATVISGEYAPIAAKDGIKLLVAARDILPNYMRLCMFAMGQTLAKRPDDAARFLAAEMTALRYAMTHRDEALKLTRRLTGAKPDDPRPEYIYDDAVRTHAVDPDISIPMDKIQWMIDFLARSGRVPSDFDVRTMIDPTIRVKALARAGSTG